MTMAVDAKVRLLPMYAAVLMHMPDDSSRTDEPRTSD